MSEKISWLLERIRFARVYYDYVTFYVVIEVISYNILS
jgi:hypothetical protein